jgi:fucose permease
MLVFICVMVDCITKTFYFPTLVNHLQIKFGLNVEIASLFFVVDMIMYVVTLQILDSIIEKIGLKMTMLFGILLNAITVLFIPPIDFLYQ